MKGLCVHHRAVGAAAAAAAGTLGPLSNARRSFCTGRRLVQRKVIAGCR